MQRETIEYLVGRGAGDGDPIACLEEILAVTSSEPFSLEAAEAFSDSVERYLRGGGQQRLVDELWERKSSLVSEYARARLAGLLGARGEALSRLDTIVRGAGKIEPALLAQRARWRIREDDVRGASADMRLALSLHPPYAFFSRAERVVERILTSPGWEPRRRCRLALLSSGTTSFLTPVLRAVALRWGIALDVYEGPFGAYAQEVIDPTSGLYAYKPEFVLFLQNHRDLSLPPSDATERVLTYQRELAGLWRTAQERLDCHVLQASLDIPWLGAWASLEDVAPGGRGRALRDLNANLAEAVRPGLSIISMEAVAAHARGPVFSETEWHGTRQYPASSVIPSFAELVVAQMRAVLGLSSKVLVLDLDNTLWGGVVGEDGLAGIRVGAPSAVGEAHAEIQRYAKELKERGVLLAVCSKNNPADAEVPFGSHDGMVLRRDDFVSFVANWKDKASNIEEMAKDLSVGLDSFVMLDDNPVERAWVRERIPEVEVPEAPGNPWDMLTALRRGLFFETLAVTAEDRERHSSYRAVVAVRGAERSGVPLEDFLRSLDMRVAHGPVGEATLERVTQLVNKTNQFNLTTRRYSAEQVRQMSEAPDWWCRWFRLEDRYGAQGLIGVLFAHRGPAEWRIDTWLMSCRVIGRRIEHFMCRCIAEAAMAGGAHTLVGEYKPTAKNGLVKGLLPDLGFDPGQGNSEFRLSLAAPWPESPFIEEDV